MEARLDANLYCDMFMDENWWSQQTDISEVRLQSIKSAVNTKLLACSLQRKKQACEFLPSKLSVRKWSQ